jgi:hypothetical protein
MARALAGGGRMIGERGRTDGRLIGEFAAMGSWMGNHSHSMAQSEPWTAAMEAAGPTGGRRETPPPPHVPARCSRSCSRSCRPGSSGGRQRARPTAAWTRPREGGGEARSEAAGRARERLWKAGVAAAAAGEAPGPAPGPAPRQPRARAGREPQPCRSRLLLRPLLRRLRGSAAPGRRGRRGRTCPLAHGRPPGSQRSLPGRLVDVGALAMQSTGGVTSSVRTHCPQ